MRELWASATAKTRLREYSGTGETPVPLRQLRAFGPRFKSHPTLELLSREGHAHEADDDFVGEGADGQGFQFLGGIERHVQNRRGAARDFSAFALEVRHVEQADSAGAQIDARRNRFIASE